MKMFKTGGFNAQIIEEVEVSRANEKSIWIMQEYMSGKLETRCARISTYTCFFDTKKQAKEYLTEKYNRELKSAEARLDKIKDNIERLDKITIT